MPKPPRKFQSGQTQLAALGVVLEPPDQAEFDRDLALTRAGLDAAAFEAACQAGTCVAACDAPQANCSGSCRNLANDGQHCGACDAPRLPAARRPSD